MIHTPRRFLTVVALCAVSGLALVGCGSSSSGAGSPSAAVQNYMQGVGSGNGGKACGALSKDLQNRALTSARSQGIKASSCSDLFSQVSKHLTSDQKTKFMHAKITHVSQSGSTATVTVQGATSQPTLTKTSGSWFITGGVGF